MNKYLVFWILSWCIFPTSAQEQILRLSPKQAETLFLQQNLLLIAERMNVDIADAAVIQAKLWDNPELSVGDAHFWSAGKEKQFSIELSQLFQTANKRRKLVNREKISKEMAVSEFEEVLRGLKTELRNSIYELEYLQTYKKTLECQQEYLGQLITAYRKQAAQGNIAKNELLRLQSSELELENEINELQTALNEQQKTLKSLLNVEPLVRIEIVKDTIDRISPDKLSLITLLETAAEQRPDLKRQQLETEYHQKSLIYEKSLRTPDITLSANYDRYGGVWQDFIGLGVSMDLPLFNRNQGNIKAARINIEKSQYLLKQQTNLVRYEISENFDNYVRTYRFHEKISENDLLSELDDMLDAYTKNLLNKNISMLEYLDFMEAYKNNKQTMLLSEKNLQTSFEELQYSIGGEIR